MRRNEEKKKNIHALLAFQLRLFDFAEMLVFDIIGISGSLLVLQTKCNQR